MIAGLLGGIAQYYSIDSTVVRIAWLIVLSFTGFIPGIIVYAIAASSLPST